MTSNGPASSPQVVEQPGPARSARRRPPRACAARARVRKPFAAKTAQPAAQLVALAAEHVRRRSRGPGGPALRSAQTFSGRSSTIATGSTSCSRASATSCAAGLGLHVGGVDDGEPAGRQPLAGDEVQHLERGRRGGLVVLVVGDQAAAEVAGDHLGRPEVRAGRTSTCPSRSRRPARPGSARGLLEVRRSCALPLSPGEDGQLGGRADLAGPRGRPAGTWPGSRSGRRPGRPRRGTRARVHSKRWSRVPHRARRPASRSARCTRRWAW